jgi:hypothetical protein
MKRTFLTTIPPKLCAMNTTGLPFSSTDCRSPSNRSSNMLAASSISVTDLLNAVSESYPYDIILLLMPESLSCLGRKSRSHSLSDAPIHVCFQCPPKPCTATMLRDLAAAVGHSREKGSLYRLLLRGRTVVEDEETAVLFYHLDIGVSGIWPIAKQRKLPRELSVSTSPLP